LLMKEQQDDQTEVDAEIEAKRVKIAESQAEAAKIREVKRAEADAASRVIMAKADSDSMQYTLPLKQKQIEQARLEAEAQKEATIKNAEAAAEAKVIDSKAEQQRQGLLAQAEADAKVVDGKAEVQRQELLADARKATTITNAEADAEAKQISSKAALETEARLADAEANRTRVTAKAEAEQLEMQAAALKQNPLLVQYTVAQRLSDKVQIMLVPTENIFSPTTCCSRRAKAERRRCRIRRGRSEEARDFPEAGGCHGAPRGVKRLQKIKRRVFRGMRCRSIKDGSD